VTKPRETTKFTLHREEPDFSPTRLFAHLTGAGSHFLPPQLFLTLAEAARREYILIADDQVKGASSPLDQPSFLTDLQAPSKA